METSDVLRRNWQNWLYLLLIIVFTVGCAWVIYDWNTHQVRLKLGLDLRSGTHITVQLLETEDPVTHETIKITEQVRNQAIQVFQNRLNALGVAETPVTAEGLDRLIIEIPEMTDLQKAEEMVRRTARLEFKEQFYNAAAGTMEWRTVMDGKYVKKAAAAPTGAGGYKIDFEMTSEGAKLFGQLTQRLVGKPLGIFFDGQPVSQPVVQEPILGGVGQITGDFTLKEAQELANYLNAGALPVNTRILEAYTVSPTLGKESLDSASIASAIGLGIVLAYMFFYYRVPGVAAGLALVVYSLVVLASMNIPGLQFVLTLPGIAGFVLSIGMAVDANVLIFERLKEELWSGKSLRLAIDQGFQRAFSSILDGHVTTFLGALILYWLGSSSIKGFGLTLMLGTAWSMITAIFVTRQFMTFFTDTLRLENRAMYGA
jgi:preprotein translocase subunit SecD